MIHITKQAEPEEFILWKRKYPNATYKEDLSNPKDKEAHETKRIVKKSLIEEQKFLCCYCECHITEKDSHIEHFKPKGNLLYENLQLDYQNLFASCIKNPTNENEELHCGHKKGNDYSNELVCPLESDCSRHFKYDMQGNIDFNDNKGEVTIKMLHLDSALLNYQRKALIDYFLDLDGELLHAEISHHLDTKRKEFGEFFTMIDYLHGNKQL